MGQQSRDDKHSGVSNHAVILRIINYDNQKHGPLKNAKTTNIFFKAGIFYYFENKPPQIC